MRESLFDNDTVNGFNSRLFLASQFSDRYDSSVWIPINQCNQFENMKALNASRLLLLDDSSMTRSQSHFPKVQRTPRNWKLAEINFEDQILTRHNEKEMKFKHKRIAPKHFTDSDESSDSNQIELKDQSLNPPTNKSCSDFYEPEPINFADIFSQPPSMNLMVFLNIMKANHNKAAKSHINYSNISNTDYKRNSKFSNYLPNNRAIINGNWMCKRCHNVSSNFITACTSCFD